MPKILTYIAAFGLILLSTVAPGLAEMLPWAKKRFSAVPPVIQPRTRKKQGLALAA